ncbi:MAG: hypothetical protein HOP30_09525 [Cyclobacteriaceae bacterium]|nr:hypothetical protein [Cyclobacteriaceae bacterium]
MAITHYPFVSSKNSLEFEFYSKGRNGKVKKLVRFSPQNANGTTYFSLGLADVDEETGNINDLSISDNQDTELILATVALTVLDFLQQFQDALIFVKGNTPSRTRLYQIGISSNWDKIKSHVLIYGHFEGQWEVYQKNKSYEAFLAKRK